MSNRRIFKYSMDSYAGGHLLQVPQGAQLLSAQMQDGRITLWAIVDPSAPVENLSLAVVGTGHEMPRTYSNFLGTVQDGPYVWHVFTRPRQ